MTRSPYEPKGMLPTDWFWVILIGALVAGPVIAKLLW